MGIQPQISNVWPIVQKAGSHTPVEPCERVGKHERHNEDARTEDQRVLGLAQIKAANTTNKQVANGKVQADS